MSEQIRSPQTAEADKGLLLLLLARGPEGLLGDAQKVHLYAEMIRLQPRYIVVVFKAIDERYGSFDRHRRDALHFSEVDVAALRVRLLD